MVRGSHEVFRFFLLFGFVFLILTAPLFGYGEYAAKIETPITPFGLTYVPSSHYLVVVQFVDGQAARYPISSVNEIGSLEPMFSPVTDGRAVGIAWCEADESLYWLQERDTPEGVTYQLLRTNIDGFALPSGPTLDVAPDVVLGDITYVPEQDAFWTVDVERDVYIAFARETGEMLETTFPVPFKHPDSGVSYGLGLDFVPEGEGYFDLILGSLTDLRAMKVVRVDLQGSPVGAEYLLDVSSDELRPGWPTGIAYCGGEGGAFTAIADSGRDRILLFKTPVPSVFGITEVTVSSQRHEIGDGGDTERITVTLSWKNNADYDAVNVEYRDDLTGEMILVDTVPQGVTQATHDLNKEGVFTYRLTPVVGTETASSIEIAVRTGGGGLVAKAPTGSPDLSSQPFALTAVEKEGLTVYVGEVKARGSETAALVHRFVRSGSDELSETTPVFSPFGKETLLVGMAWNPKTDELVWLGQSSFGEYELARTTPEGEVTQAPVPFSRNPFPGMTLGDIACDPSTGNCWTVTVEKQTLWAFDPQTGVPTGDEVKLPDALPEEPGTWGYAAAVAIRPGPAEGTDIFFVGMGIVPTDKAAPAPGTGSVKRLVPLIRYGEEGALLIGKPVDLELSTGSALVRGFYVTGETPPHVFLAAQDVGWLYELALLGPGNVFARGDANSDGSINVADVLFTLNYLFDGGETPGCLDAADANDSGTVNLSDALYLLRHVFDLLEGSARASPFGVCGTDPNTDDLSCESYPPCR